MNTTKEIKSFVLLMKRLIILLIGLSIAHLGVTLFLMSNLGADPFNVFVQGVFRSTSKLFGDSLLTHGRVHMIINFVIILVLLLFDHSYIKIGTIVCMLLGGPIIDLFTYLMNKIIPSDVSMAGKIIMLALGCIILAYGMTIVIKSEAGTGPNDLVSVVLSEKLHVKFSVIRVITDLTFVLIGFCLHASLGIGTIVCVGLVGPVAGVFLPINEKLIKKILSVHS